MDQKLKEYDDEFEKNMKSIEMAQKKIETKLLDRQIKKKNISNYDQNDIKTDQYWDNSAQSFIKGTVTHEDLFLNSKTNTQNATWKAHTYRK